MLIRIGEVEFQVAKPCSRCIMTTVEEGTDRFNAIKEPLATLTRYRRGEDGEVYFGQNLIALNEGWIESGSEIEVLERKRPAPYHDGAPKKRELVCVAREPLAWDLETFWFEAANGEPLPDYLPGQHLPINLDIKHERVQRRYTLSSTPDLPERYSISVKKVGGAASPTGYTRRCRWEIPCWRVSPWCRALSSTAFGRLQRHSHAGDSPNSGPARRARRCLLHAPVPQRSGYSGSQRAARHDAAGDDPHHYPEPAGQSLAGAERAAWQ